MTRTNLGTDEGDALPTVEMDIDEQDGLPLPPARAMRAPGGWRPAQQGPIVIWTCVGAGVCLLLLLYVMFSTEPSSVRSPRRLSAPAGGREGRHQARRSPTTSRMSRRRPKPPTSAPASDKPSLSGGIRRRAATNPPIQV